MTTTDETRGHPLKERVETRKAELEDALSREGTSERTRADAKFALDSLDLITTQGLDHIDEMSAARLNDWLERHKYIAIQQRPERRQQPRPNA